MSTATIPAMVLRTILGIVAGDAIFLISTASLFYFSRVDPHAPATPRFIVLSILYGVAFSLLAGFVGGLVGARPDVVTGMVLACIIAVPAAATLVSRPGEGALWSQMAALLVMAPAALTGDLLRKSRRTV